MQDEIIKGSGRYMVRLTAFDTGNGVSLCLSGGEVPHVGGAVLAAPRPSLTGEGQSCDLWIVTAPGHKDVFLAQKAAGRLCSALGVTVCVSAGIHIEGARSEELKTIEANAMEAVEDYISRVDERRRDHER